MVLLSRVAVVIRAVVVWCLLYAVLCLARREERRCPLLGKTKNNQWKELMKNETTMGHVPLSCLPKKARRVCRSIAEEWEGLRGSERCRISQAHVVEGFFVVVYDDCIPDQYREMLFQKFKHSQQYERTQSDGPETAEYSYYKEAHDVSKVMSSSLGRVVIRLAKNLIGCDFAANSVYTNAIQYGDALFTHTDATSMTPGFYDMQFVTALIYMNSKWRVDWGGETIFASGKPIDVRTGKINPEGEVVAGVSPKPGRIVLFDSRIRHSARPPQKVFLARRFTTAMKLRCESKGPLLPPNDREYYEREEEMRKAYLTSVNRVPGSIQVPDEMRESHLREL